MKNILLLIKVRSKSLLQALRYRPQFRVNLTGWATEDQTADGVPCKLNVAEAAQDVYFALSNNYTSSCCILYRVLCLALLSANTPNTSAQVISVECLHVFDLKGFKEEIIKSQDCNGILEVEAEHKGL